jgi:hypothetical protein
LINSKYGPTLGKEFHDAGVGGLPFSWNNDEVFFDPSMTDDQKSTVLAVMEAHDPTATLPVVEVDPVDKLKAFLAQNPDVAAMLQGA